jgi:hypothetical protein
MCLKELAFLFSYVEYYILLSTFQATFKYAATIVIDQSCGLLADVSE